MTGITDLTELLSSMQPELQPSEFVFCHVSGELSQHLTLNPIATFIEAEGLTLVLEKTSAEQAGIPFDGRFKQITLTVHSSLEAVGLTAAVSGQLANKGISANVIAAYYHDHIFVPADQAEAALAALSELSR
ncbi:ACT domain-containing protein [Motilimonas eburnea]|uniref:ACT domain-containing protein n=1 Tax=Motilimonas eburnea TaxID=1737488 RepID=UPI001E3709DE|nr:ACT domain-containing protein [Motilimonas eburnea]MCE2571172.1 ACT domain-containing protein [Motilimonas eburnea]